MGNRRSQAQRTEETRGKIVGAVVESIHEVGLPRTTAAEVARRAGVTWGAVQHHFGGKSGMLDAVLEHSFDDFVAWVNANVPIGTVINCVVKIAILCLWL